MAAKKRTPAKRPGKNVEEWQRHKVQVKLRVGETIADAIAERSAELGVDKSKYVSQLVLADVARQAGVELPLPTK